MNNITKETIAKNKPKKTKLSRFSHILQHPAWEQNRPILKQKRQNKQ